MESLIEKYVVDRIRDLESEIGHLKLVICKQGEKLTELAEIKKLVRDNMWVKDNYDKSRTYIDINSYGMKQSVKDRLIEYFELKGEDDEEDEE